jgi:membrane protein
MLNKLITFFKNDLWSINEGHLTNTQRFQIKCLRILLLSKQAFAEDLCLLRASALTLYTVLSIVPIIAMLFGIAKGFGFETTLKQQLLEQNPEQEVIILRLLEFSENMLANTEGGVIAGIGIIVLFWTVIQVIANIEESFNHIWKIKKNRDFTRKLTDYLSLMLLAPVLLIASSSITVFVTTKITGLIERTQLPEKGTASMLYLLSYSPMFIMSALFSFVFIFMPNQKIQLKAGIIAGGMTGVLYQIIQSGYLELQLGVSNYNAIYGSFTALPLFVMWLQVGWLLVLFGCEISFFIQHYDLYKHHKKFLSLSFRLKKIIALRIMQLIVKQFIQAKTALDTPSISMTLSLPISVVQSSLSSLIKCHFIVELKKPEKTESIFQPAKDIHQLTVHEMIKTLEEQGENQLPNMKSFAEFSKITAAFDEKIQTSSENCLLKEV